jgi:TetR/AcrR family transcriptional regulator, transcriptional repressor for nem operon
MDFRLAILTKWSTIPAMGRTSDAKDRLMTAALDLMWEESYGAITIDDICRRAVVKKGSFYYFFESKSDLVITALERLWIEKWKPMLDAQFSPSVEPLKRLTNYLETIYLKQVEAKKDSGRVLGCPVCSVGSEISTQDELLGDKVRELCGRKRRYFESAIRDAVAEGSIEPCDPVEKVTTLIGLMEGILTQGRIMNDPEMIRRLPSMAMDLLRAKAPIHASASH